MTDSLSELYTRHCRPRIGEILQSLKLDVVFHRAEGDFLFYRDEKGEEVKVTDFLGGYGALIFGHNHPELVATIKKAYDDKLPFLAQMSCRANAGRLGAKLHQMMLARTGNAYITTLASTGTEAVEAAMKHATYSHAKRISRIKQELDDKVDAARRGLHERRYTLSSHFYERARAWLRLTSVDDFELVVAAVQANNHRVLQTPSVFIALERAFHGKTLGSVALTHYADYRRHFLHSSPRTLFIEPGDERGLEEAVRGTKLACYSLSVGADNQISLVEETHSNVAALFVEPLQGEGGIRLMSRPFMKRCRDLATESSFPLVFDEIQSGMGRTGTFLFSEQQGIFADYYILSKGLGGGVAKVSALLVEKSHYEHEFGLIHTSTFAEDEISSAVALKALELIDGKPELMRNCVERGQQLKDGLQQLKMDFPTVIQDVRGAGLMLGVEFRRQEDRGSPAIAEVFAQGLLGYVISGYLLHEHRLRIAPTISNKSLVRIEPSALISEDECDILLGALRSVCEILENQNAYELFRFAVGNPRRATALAPPMQSYRGPVREAASRDVNARVAFVGYFVKSKNVRQWDASMSAFTDEQLAELIRRIYPVMDPFVVDERIIQSSSGRRVSLTVVGIPTDSDSFAALMKSEERDGLVERIEAAVALAADRGCTVAALGGFTSIVTGNGRGLRVDGRIAVTTGNSLTVAMGLESILQAASRAEIDLSTSCFAAIGASGNIGSIYSQVLADRVPRMVLLGRPGRLREVENVAADIYLHAARDLVARTRASSGQPQLGGIASAIAETRVIRDMVEARTASTDARQLYEAINAELRDKAPITVTADPEMLRYANLILGASNSPTPVIHAQMLGSAPVVICDVAIPSDVDDAVRSMPNVTVVEGGLVQLPLDKDFTIRGLDMPEGHLYACCCEGLLMGLTGMREHYSHGAITKSQVLQIMQVARMHGFSLGARAAAHSL
ncbi:aminotransferase class III-fold pyridoxal phosphate-dependent enzyme [Stigmatella sp. ncwal1]|uniref:Aminotransferase class III-fold pyridoxal phosphate-dependent enzyme n=1 Tax=Stigmatella ashevillensis TaxID=2995309 RepID=A0ABT5D4P7_9BACT|nr:aminotransferase class III-fold pyridoxal phosphate-dependent enzyme [Stigmatella ashevillena]MDC0708546.1 aminotransferase class III-fold pyridoxal phosphate-dependent enzyme [Stigmatella ashevillena]